MAPGFYISKKGAKSLRDNYKYVSSDKSLLTKLFLGSYWEWAVQFVPIWMAPNVVTVLGLLSLLPCITLTLYYAPTFTEAHPWWLHLVCAFGIFAYATLDALDGKQARRTGTSGPLGELFDHGCDSIAIGLIGIRILSMLRLGFDITIMLLFLLAMATFYLATWEYYLTGTMLFRQINPVVEGIHFVVSIEIFMSIFGTEFLTVPVELLGGILVREILKNVGIVAVCSQILNSVIAVVKSENVDRNHALSTLLPCFAIVLFNGIWILKIWPISDLYCIVLLFATLFHFAWHSDTTVLAAVSKMPIDISRKRMWIGVIPSVIGTVGAIAGYDQYAWVFILDYLLFSVGFHIHMVISTVTDLAEILNIRVFKLKKKAKKAASPELGISLNRRHSARLRSKN